MWTLLATISLPTATTLLTSNATDWFCLHLNFTKVELYSTCFSVSGFSLNITFNCLFKLLVHVAVYSFYCYILFHYIQLSFSILYLKCWLAFGWISGFSSYEYIFLWKHKHFCWVYTEEWNLPNFLWKCIFLSFSSIRPLLISAPLILSSLSHGKAFWFK